MQDFSTASYEQMSPTLLAQQPPTPRDEIEKSPDWWNSAFAYFEQRLGTLRAWRFSWWAFWSILARLFIPRRYTWLVVANRMWKGSYLNDAIIDSTGLLAVRTCASGMWTGLTSPSRPWFKLDQALPWVQIDADGKEWLEDTQQRVYTVMAQSNFYTSMAQAFQDLTVFGTCPVIIYEDYEDVIRCYVPCAGEYYLATGARLAVNTLYREFVLTVLQIVDQFTLEECPQQIKKLWSDGGSNLDTEFVVAHAIEPNFSIAKKGEKGGKVDILPGKFSWREVYWLKGMKTGGPLSRRGFNDQPFMAFRWAVVSNDPYGRGPCMDAIGDNKQVQQETLRKGEYIEKGVRPSMGANVELKNEPSSILPGMITYMSTEGGKKGFWPLFEVNPAWLTGITADIKEVNARINHCLFVDLFMAITQMQGVQPRNELELTKRDLERLQELGPVIELVENELAIGIRRIIDILTRRRMLKPMPQSLQNVPLKIAFTSIMKLAQKSAESVAMKDVFGTMGELSSAAKAAGVPDPIRVFNLDKSARKYADLNNYPADCIFTEGEVNQHDKIREQQQQQQKMTEVAPAAVTAAKTLADTKIEPGNALSAMLPPGGLPNQQ